MLLVYEKVLQGLGRVRNSGGGEGGGRSGRTAEETETKTEPETDEHKHADETERDCEIFFFGGERCLRALTCGL